MRLRTLILSLWASIFLTSDLSATIKKGTCGASVAYVKFEAGMSFQGATIATKNLITGMIRCYLEVYDWTEDGKVIVASMIGSLPPETFAEYEAEYTKQEAEREKEIRKNAAAVYLVQKLPIQLGDEKK